jgi:hypothetical protein
MTATPLVEAMRARPAATTLPSAPPFVLLLVLFWLSVLGHEAAHFGVAALVYSPEELRTGSLRSGAQLLAVGAGPLFTLLLLGASVVGVHRSHGATWRLAWSSLFASAASRIALVGPGTLLGTAINDEQTLGRVLGVSPRLLWCGEALFALMAPTFVMRAWMPAMRTKVVQWITVTLVVGWGSALVLGPMLGLPI